MTVDIRNLAVSYGARVPMIGPLPSAHPQAEQLKPSKSTKRHSSPYGKKA